MYKNDKKQVNRLRTNIFANFDTNKQTMHQYFFRSRIMTIPENFHVVIFFHKILF